MGHVFQWAGIIYSWGAGPLSFRAVTVAAPMESLTAKSAFELFLLGSSEDVVDAFFKRWPPDVILRLRCLNSSIYLAVEAYIMRAWSINDALSPWFFEPQKFLRTLEQCDGIVSGSAALLFLGRDNFVPSDLDIYVPLHGLLAMGRYLKAESFRYQSTGGVHPLFDVAALSLSSAMERHPSRLSRRRGFPTSLIATFNFYRPDSGFPVPGREGTHVQVSVTCQDPVNFVIESFHSSECQLHPCSDRLFLTEYVAGVMNYITPMYAVSLFPCTTFLERRSLVCQDIRQSMLIHRGWMEKYRRRGFEIITAESPYRATYETRCWDREVGDDLTWVLPLRRGSKWFPLLYVIQGLRICTGITDHRQAAVGVPRIKFEALGGHFQVCAAGAAMRTGPPFKYR